MADQSQRLKAPKRRRRLLIGLGVLLLATVLAFVFLKPGSGSEGKGDGAQQTTVATVQPFSASLNFTGVIVAGEGVPVTAPFDGTIKALHFSYGARVEPGQRLIEMDTLDIDRTYNEATTAYLKAGEQAQTMATWESGQEVTRARRAVESAEYDLEDTRRKMAESQALYAKGLVPRSEIDGHEQTLRAREIALTTAKEELAVTLERGRGSSRRVAEIELENAESRYRTVREQRARSVLTAPSAGVIVKPPARKAPDAADDEIYAGARLNNGQLIGTIIQAGDLAVRFTLDEADVNQIRIGQKLTVSGAGFPGVTLKGEIVSISAEGSNNQGGGKATFAATARLEPLAAEQAEAVRIGMSANIVVETYANPQALVVPPEAVRGAAPRAFVRVQEKGGQIRNVPVKVGQVSPSAVEITEGLRAGQMVVWEKSERPRRGREQN